MVCHYSDIIKERYRAPTPPARAGWNRAPGQWRNIIKPPVSHPPRLYLKLALHLPHKIGKRTMSTKMATPLLPLLTVLFLAATVANGQKPTPCTSKQLAFNATRVSFNTSNALCATVWGPQDFVLLYKHEDAKTWNFVLSAPTTSKYIAIGFSPDGAMVGSSAVVGWLPDGGKGTAKQYYLGDKSPSAVEADKGNLSLASGKTTIFSESSRVYLAFQLTGTEKPRDKLLYAIGPTPGSNNVLSHHDDKISTTFEYVSEQGAPSPSTEGPPGSGTGSPPPSGNTAGRLTMATVPAAISIMLAMLLL